MSDPWVGPQVRWLRSLLGITQDKLGEILGVSCCAVSRWESRRVQPPVRVWPWLSVLEQAYYSAIEAKRPIGSIAEALSGHDPLPLRWHRLLSQVAT